MRAHRGAHFVVLALAAGALSYPAEAEHPKLQLRAGPSREATPAGKPEPPESIRSGADTLRFGFYTMINGDPYAVPGEVWTFDHGAADPLEGWNAQDQSGDSTGFFRVVTPATWAGHGNLVGCPEISPAGTAWVGVFEDEAAAACYSSGLGYGNGWAQRYTSPLFDIPGSGDLSVRFRYFADLEPDFDRVRVKIVFPNDAEIASGEPIDGVRGDPSTGTWADGLFTVPAAQLAGQTQCRLRFEMTSDLSYSDEDGAHATEYGPFGFGRVSAQRDGPLLAQYFDQALGLAPQQAMNGAYYFGQLGRSVCLLDVNRDGYDDVIVGEPRYANGQSQEGRVQCFHGGPGGISSTPSWSYEPNVVGATFGWSVAGGILDWGSPFPILIVGAPYYSNGQFNEGQISVFGTSTAGLDATPAFTYESDIATAYIGYSVACGESGGGFYFVAGAPFYSNGETSEGRLYGWSILDLGLPPTWTRESDQAGCALGATLAWIDDATYGGSLAVGIPYYDGAPGENCGAVELRHPASGLLGSRLLGFQTGSGLGVAIAPLGDFNGDDGTDLAATAWRHTSATSVNNHTPRGAGYMQFHSAVEDPSFDLTICAVGRLDDDVTGDIAMVGGSTAQARLLDLDASPSTTWTERWSVAVPGSSATMALAGSGDVDGDGRNDLLIGAPDYDGGLALQGRFQLHLSEEIAGPGWVASAIPPLGDQAGVAPASAYGLPAGACGMSGNVLEMHDAGDAHPAGQHVRFFSPIVDLASVPDDHDIHAVRWDAFDSNPFNSGLFINYGWIYYPWTCPATGQIGWSRPGAVPSNDRPWWGGIGGCWAPSFASETESMVEVPPSATKMRFYFEVVSSCEEFGIPPENCLPTDFSPLFDNIVLEEIDGGSISGVVKRRQTCSQSGNAVPNVIVGLNPGGDTALTDNNGRFAFYDLTPGSYTVTVNPPVNWTFQCGQAAVNFNGAPVRGLQYGIYPSANIIDLALAVAGGQAKPGFETRYGITCSNPGTVPAGAPVTLHLPPEVSFASADWGGVYQSSDHTVRWSQILLAPSTSRVLSVIGTVAVDANLGEELLSTAEYGPPSGDAHPADNAASCTQVVVGALDPNDKHVSPEGNIPVSQTLAYQVNFQNVGTAEATNIRIEDPLDDDLDLSTMTFGSSSHAPTEAYVNGQTAIWEFDNILLPDSSTNEPGSHGFVTFHARPKAGLPPGRQITNGARIFFDYAPAIWTNTVTNTIVDPAGVEAPEPAAVRFALTSIGPVPARGPVQLLFAIPDGGRFAANIYDAGGRKVRALAGGGCRAGALRLEWDRRSDAGREVGAGIYFLRSRWESAEASAVADARIVLLE